MPTAPLPRAFGVLLASEFVSLVGDRLALVALVTLVYQRTESAWVVAVLLLAKAIPAALLGGVAGSIVDRFSRRGVMVVANAVQGALVLAIPSAQHVAVIIAIYLAMSVVNQFFVPARAATIPDLVSPDRLVSANSAFGVAFVAAIAVGPALGAWVADAHGLAAAFYVDAATFWVPAVAVGLTRLPARTPRRPAGRLLADAREGVRHARTDAASRVALVATAGSALLIASLSVLGVVVADGLGLGVGGYGAMMSAMGAGMLAAALLLGRRRRASTRQALGGLLVAGAGVAVLAWLAVPAAALACSAVVGGGVLAVQVSAQTILQSAPDALRARVLSLGQSVTGLAQIAATISTALLVAPLGAAWVLCASGLAAALTAALLWRTPSPSLT